jgi:hypothetical protein
MKILIGTPIHEVKDYAMERWLKNVAALRQVTPADFLMVDNSPDLSYVEKVKEYCKKLHITDYKIEHIDVWQENGSDERIGRSREVIRQEILKNDYDAWFSWECDQIIPNNTLEVLANIMKAGDYKMVNPSTSESEIQRELNANFGCCLIHRWGLEKHSFLLENNPSMGNTWHAGDVWFKKQLLKDGGSYIEIYGIINPIYHLSDPNKT